MVVSGKHRSDMKYKGNVPFTQNVKHSVLDTYDIVILCQLGFFVNNQKQMNHSFIYSFHLIRLNASYMENFGTFHQII